MSSSSDPWFVGVGARTRDAALVLEVRAQRDANGIRDVSSHSHALFPPNGEVELRGISATIINPGDWAVFRVTTEGPPNRTRFRAADCRRLLLFEDLSHLGSSEAARRLLVEDGRLVDVGGDKLVRIGEAGMVQVRIARSGDGSWRAIPSLQMPRLPVWRFEELDRLSVSVGSDRIELLDPKDGLVQIGNVDWSSDADFIRRMMNLLGRADSGNDRALRQFADALRDYARDLELRQGAFDPGTAQEILRSSRLASLIESQQDVLTTYFSALRKDPDVKRLIDARIEELAERTIASQRPAIIERLCAELQGEIATRRTLLEADLKKSIEDLDKELTEGVERRLADLEKGRRDEVESTIGRRKDGLETEVAGLEAKRAALESEIAALRDKGRELAAAVQDLSDREAAALEKLDSLTRAGEVLASRSGGIGAALPPACSRFSEPAREIGTEGASEWIAKCQLLTSRGKDSLRKFVALLLAGEVPLLLGAQAEDFLEIAQALVSGGRSVRLEADPTVIAFEDLWTRAGTQTATALREAATDAVSGQSRSHLCVVSRADRSGARFWYPALAETARRGGLPPRLLICTMLEDEKSDEAKHMLREGISLRIEDVVAPGAALIAPVKLSGPTADLCELLPPERAADLVPAVPKLVGIAGSLRIADAERMARIAIAAGLLMEPLHVEAFVRETAGQLPSAESTASEGTAPNLKVIAAGG
jgi:hypothetical protein